MKTYYKIIDGNTIYSQCRSLKAEKEVNGRIIKYTIFNPTEEQILAAGWIKVTEPELSDEEKLQKAKLDKIAQIDNYDASSEVEMFTINGIPMWLGHELRQQIRTSAEAYSSLGYTEMTKVFEGVEYTFPITTWIQMLDALEVYAAEALNTTERHKNIVNTLTTIQEIVDYDYTTAYPLKLSFGQNDSQDGAV